MPSLPVFLSIVALAHAAVLDEGPRWVRTTGGGRRSSPVLLGDHALGSGRKSECNGRYQNYTLERSVTSWEFQTTLPPSSATLVERIDELNTLLRQMKKLDRLDFEIREGPSNPAWRREVVHLVSSPKDPPSYPWTGKGLLRRRDYFGGGPRQGTHILTVKLKALQDPNSFKPPEMNVSSCEEHGCFQVTKMENDVHPVKGRVSFSASVEGLKETVNTSTLEAALKYFPTLEYYLRVNADHELPLVDDHYATEVEWKWRLGKDAKGECQLTEWYADKIAAIVGVGPAARELSCRLKRKDVRSAGSVKSDLVSMSLLLCGIDAEFAALVVH